MRVKNRTEKKASRTIIKKLFFVFVLSLSIISIALLLVGFANNPVTFLAGIPLGIFSIKLQDLLYS